MDSLNHNEIDQILFVVSLTLAFTMGKEEESSLLRLVSHANPSNESMLFPLTGPPSPTQPQAENRRTACQISGTPPAEYLSARQDPHPAESVP